MRPSSLPSFRLAAFGSSVRFFRSTAFICRNLVRTTGRLLGFALALCSMSHAQTNPGRFSATGYLNSARAGHTATATATLLRNGEVLTAGGYNSGYLSTAELYDPLTKTFTITGSLNTARYFHTATLLENGKVLVVGGYGSSGTLASAELYDPSTGLFTPTGSLNTARYFHTATLLENGT